MKLPNRGSAYVQREKLADYLLSDRHPDGRSKARLLRTLGFDMLDVGALKAALLVIARSEEVEVVVNTVHGAKYVIDGLPSPCQAGRRRRVIGELEIVVITHDVGQHGLKQGDVGTVVHRYDDGAAYEVEFVMAQGDTVALLTLGPADIRIMSGTEILHAREVTPA
jgi:hypothetical protein